MTPRKTITLKLDELDLSWLVDLFNLMCELREFDEMENVRWWVRRAMTEARREAEKTDDSEPELTDSGE